MDLKDTLRSFFREIILPELSEIKSEQRLMSERLDGVDNRLSDINTHLVDQSRRIDETNQRIDAVREELLSHLGGTNARIDRLYEVIVRREEHTKLDSRVADLEKRLGEIERKLAA
jgi:chromosome segregation ATPase